MKKKYYFIGLFVIVTTLLFTMVSSVEANNQIETEFQTNNRLTQFKLQNNLWYSGNQINNLNSTLDRLTSNLEFQQSNPNNLLPNIKAELSSVTPTSGPNGQEIEVTYTITPESFVSLNNDSSSNSAAIEEAVIILDLSQDMYLYKRWDAIRESIVSELIDNEDLMRSNLALSIIGYNQTSVYPTLNQIDYKRLFKLNNNEEKEIIKNLIEQPYIYAQSGDHTRNIDQALIDASEILSQSKTDNNKAIIIISNENINANEFYINQIKDKGYNIISLKLGEQVNLNHDDKSLQELHNALGGNGCYFEVSTPESMNWQPYSDFDDEVSLIREALLGSQETIEDNFSVNPTLNFDLGNNFLPVSGLISTGGTSYQLKVPTITYTPVTKNDDGTYTYESDQKQIDVSFIVKVDTNQIGDITFSNKDDVEFNNLTYTNLNDEEIKAPIETPTFTVVGETELPTYSNDTIKILEIEPADYFRLGSSQGLETGTEELRVGDESVEITRMTMPEFIGKAEKLNGKYDVIVIGRLVNTSWGKDSNHQKKYQDYSFTRNDTVEENDITNRKAQEIIEFINSGQLVYLDRDILKEDIKDTKLYRNFEHISGTNLIKDKSINELSINEILKYYTESILPQQKQLNLEVIDATPSDITTDVSDSADGIAANRTRKMIISANSLNSLTDDSQISEDVSITLYLDLDGDGLFFR